MLTAVHEEISFTATCKVFDMVTFGLLLLLFACLCATSGMEEEKFVLVCMEGRNRVVRFSHAANAGVGI